MPKSGNLLIWKIKKFRLNNGKVINNEGSKLIYLNLNKLISIFIIWVQKQ